MRVAVLIMRPILQIRLGVCFLNLPVPLSKVSVDLFLVFSFLFLLCFLFDSVFLFFSLSIHVFFSKGKRKEKKENPDIMSDHVACFLYHLITRLPRGGL